MVYLMFGEGNIGVETLKVAVPAVHLSKLDENLDIGSKIGDGVGSEDVVRMVFKNIEGLDVLLNALLECRRCLNISVEIPPELRFGA